jgi:hypothetical protein
LQRKSAAAFANSCAVEPEKFLRSCGGRASDFIERDPAGRGNAFRNQASVGGFGAFPAKWRRGEIWAIGFDHEFA